MAKLLVQSLDPSTATCLANVEICFYRQPSEAAAIFRFFIAMAF